MEAASDSCFKEGAIIHYFSKSMDKWVAAKVLTVHDNGTYTLNCKKNVKVANMRPLPPDLDAALGSVKENVASSAAAKEAPKVEKSKKEKKSSKNNGHTPERNGHLSNGQMMNGDGFGFQPVAPSSAVPASSAPPPIIVPSSKLPKASVELANGRDASPKRSKKDKKERGGDKKGKEKEREDASSPQAKKDKREKAGVDLKRRKSRSRSRKLPARAAGSRSRSAPVKRKSASPPKRGRAKSSLSPKKAKRKDSPSPKRSPVRKRSPSRKRSPEKRRSPSRKRSVSRRRSPSRKRSRSRRRSPSRKQQRSRSRSRRRARSRDKARRRSGSRSQKRDKERERRPRSPARRRSRSGEKRAEKKDEKEEYASGGKSSGKGGKGDKDNSGRRLCGDFKRGTCTRGAYCRFSHGEDGEEGATDKGATAKGDGKGKDARPGDWNCPNCGIMVFASKKECFKCHTTREGGKGDGKGDERPPPDKYSEALWERPRQELGLTTIGENSAMMGVQWVYAVQDENRRCFAGFLPSQFTKEQTAYMFQQSRDGIKWDQPEGPNGPIPRKTAWLVAPNGCNCTYRYGKIEVEPIPYPPFVQEIMQLVMPRCGLMDQSQWPNCCNVNLYEDGAMSVGWHSDDESLFQGKFQDIRIISLSLGQKRKFELRANWPGEGDSNRLRPLMLGDGDLCTMEGMFQKHYMHRVPKEPNSDGPRINFTWRWNVKHTPRCPITRTR